MSLRKPQKHRNTNTKYFKMTKALYLRNTKNTFQANVNEEFPVFCFLE